MELSLKAKILGLCAGLSVVTGVVGYMGKRGLDTVTAKYDHIATINLKNSHMLAEMEDAFRRASYAARTLGMTGVPAQDAEKAIATLETSIKEFESYNVEYLSIDFVEGEEELYKPIVANWNAYKVLAQQIPTLYKSGTQADKEKMQNIFYVEAPVKAAALSESIDKLIDFQMNESKKWVDQAQSAASAANRLSTILVLAGAGFSLGLGFFFATWLTRAIQGIAENLASGSREVSQASESIASAAAQLSASATEQAASLQETVATVDEISAMISKNAENARKGLEASNNSNQTANRGKEAVGEVLHSIDDISKSNTEIMEQINRSNQEISEIVKLIKEIGNKTKVINDIVFQTKLLSFNASVEAARAGEHGKGFAVVAEEVGNLAQMSGNAAKEISQMLEDSIRRVETIVNDTKAKVERLILVGRQKVDTGSVTARRCGEVLDEIVGSVTELNSMVSEIATACQEQAHGVQEITKAMSQLDEVTQQNAAASRQSATGAEGLSTQAVALQSSVEKLLATVMGSRKTAPAPKEKERPPVTSSAPVQKAPAQAPASEPKKAVASTGNIVPFPAKKAEKPQGSVPGNVPTEDDPRFKDV